MIYLLNILFFLAFVSHVPVLYCQLKLNIVKPINKFIFYYSIAGFIGYALFYLFNILYQNSYPVGHVLTIVQFFIFLNLLRKMKYSVPFIFLLGSISALVFIYYCLHPDGLFQIDEVNFTYSNIVIVLYSFLIFKGQLENQRKLESTESIISSILFISTSSKLILGIFENEIRLDQTILSFFLVLVFNGLIIFQNIGFYWSLWKLKEV